MAGSEHLRLALLSEVFHGEGAAERLATWLDRARAVRAQLVVLPELGLDPWIPATREVRDDDAELVDGPRRSMVIAAARKFGVAVLGSAIVRDPSTGQRTNQAFLIDGTGAERGRYSKLHIPHEPGFWEADHYAHGPEAFSLMGLHGVPLGIQICSDINRPQGTHILAARGARLVIHPRATQLETFDQWRLVMRATARTAGVWIASVNRPRSEQGVSLGGPSIVVDPTGEVAAEGYQTMMTFDIDTARNEEASRRYPGYLAVRSEVYANGWSETLPRELVPPPHDDEQ